MTRGPTILPDDRAGASRGASAAESAAAEQSFRVCPCCGLAQRVPPVPPRRRACCARCGSTLALPASRRRSASRTAAIASAALILYPFAVLLPMLRIEQLGHRHDASVIDGVIALLAEGHLFVGVVVLLCSIILPVAKLGGLLAICTGGAFMGTRHRAWTYRFIEWTGRWGMLDVLAVAVLVAVVKLRSSVDLTAGPGAAAFAAVVILSLLASASFDPHSLWHDDSSDPRRNA